jgi:hypothetical protein
LTASGIFWEEKRNKEEKGEEGEEGRKRGIQGPSPHNTDTSTFHLIYMGIQGGVKRSGKEGNKWKR